MTILPRHIVYWLLGLGSMGLLAFEGPTSSLLVGGIDRGKAEKGAQTVRGRPVFVWAGGGYQGGK